MKKKITTWTSFFKSKQGKRLFLVVLFAGLIVLPFVSNTLVKRIASTIFIYSRFPWATWSSAALPVC